MTAVQKEQIRREFAAGPAAAHGRGSAVGAAHRRAAHPGSIR
jgi:hypothetical protein